LVTLLGAVFIIGCAGYQPAPLAPERSGLLRSSERRRLDIESARLETRNARLQSMDRISEVRQALIASLSEIESADQAPGTGS
jgi:hypothetical protein